MADIRTEKWVYDHLVCELGHWDRCLSGLVKDGDKLRFVEIQNEYPKNRKYLYEVTNIEWTTKCQEWLDDYRVAYKHCFHEGKPRCRYEGWDLNWFYDKWHGKRPWNN